MKLTFLLGISKGKGLEKTNVNCGISAPENTNNYLFFLMIKG